MRKTVVMLLPDPWLREALAETLAPFAPEIDAFATADREAAGLRLASGQVDLLVVDLGASVMDGFVLAVRLLRALPDVPIIALTREGAPQVSKEIEERSLRALRKPIDFSRFREAVLDLLQRAPRGHLSGVSAAGLLQLLSMEERSGVLVLDSPRGRGRLVIDRGQLVDAEAMGARGEEAVLRIAEALSQAQCDIVLEDLAGPVVRTIQRPLEGMLLDAARRRDEGLREEARAGEAAALAGAP